MQPITVLLYKSRKYHLFDFHGFLTTRFTPNRMLCKCNLLMIQKAVAVKGSKTSESTLQNDIIVMYVSTLRKFIDFIHLIYICECVSSFLLLPDTSISGFTRVPKRFCPFCSIMNLFNRNIYL